MRYEYLHDTLQGVKIYGRIDDDGLMRITCTADNPECQAWLNQDETSTPIVKDEAKTK